MHSDGRAGWLTCLPRRADVSIVHGLVFPSAAAAAGATASAVPGIIACAAASVANGTCVDPTPTAAAAAAEVSESSMEFLPLMMTSVYCAVGIVWSWARLSWGFLTS